MVRLRVGLLHSQFWPILTRFMDYYSPFWGSQSDLHGCRTPRCAYVLVVKTCSLVDSGPFLGLLLSFCVPKGFPRLTNPKVRLHVGDQHTQFWPILARFVDYYSLFWVPE